MRAFPSSLGRLCFQSKFGPGEWLRPYTNEACRQILDWHQGRENVVFIPISFTSDHIETLYEIEELYLPLIREKGLMAKRCPALNLDKDWIDSLQEISEHEPLIKNNQLVRRRILKNRVVSLLP
jgi:ferrochelatase